MDPITGTDLVYNIAEELLTGELDGIHVTAHAVAGGRAGSKKGAKVVNPMLANNPFATRIKQDGIKPGGPLPMTKYNLQFDSRKNHIRLAPINSTEMHGRDSMLIHGRGPLGSYGCIVPTDFHIVELIYERVKARHDEGKPDYTLAVVTMGDIDGLQRKFERLSRTA